MVRLDAIMEENRLAAVARAEAEEDRRHRLRLQNLSALKEQISAHETAKVDLQHHHQYIAVARHLTRS